MSTLGLTIANPDLVNGNGSSSARYPLYGLSLGIVVGHFLRRITERLDLGAELVYQYDKKSIPGTFPAIHFELQPALEVNYVLFLGNQISVLSYAARYTAPHWVFSGTVGPSGLHACYHHKQSETLQFGVEFESNFRMQEAVTTFAYQVRGQTQECNYPNPVPNSGPRKAQRWSNVGSNGGQSLGPLVV